jgi:hypothetical protein
MAYPSHVNSQVTDSVTAVNTQVIGDSPAMATGNLYVATSQALSNAAHNASNNQNQFYVTGQAVTTQGVSSLLAVDVGSAGIGTGLLFSTGTV